MTSIGWEPRKDEKRLLEIYARTVAPHPDWWWLWRPERSEEGPEFLKRLRTEGKDVAFLADGKGQVLTVDESIETTRRIAAELGHTKGEDQSISRAGAFLLELVRNDLCIVTEGPVTTSGRPHAARVKRRLEARLRGLHDRLAAHNREAASKERARTAQPIDGERTWGDNEWREQD